MEKMANVDFHMHTAHSPDSEADMGAMCEAAAAGGLYGIAITDHVEIDAFYEDGYDRTLAASYKQAGEMQSLFAGRLRIARGVELGQPLHNLDISQTILNTYAFDFVLGSLHNLIKDKDFYHYDYRYADIPSLMDAYFVEVLDMVRWGRFHSLAHLTYPFRYFPADRYPADYSRWQDTIDGILRTLAEKGLALEINTSGLRQPIGKTLPDLPLIRRFHELGGEKVTIGSDAHRPEDVAKHNQEGIAIANQAGFRYITVFFGGEPEMLAIG